MLFFNAITFFGCNSLKRVSLNNQECKIRSEIIDVNSNEPTFCPYSIEVNKCSGSCNNINYVLLMLLRTNEIRHIKWHETCKDASVCNNKQLWNNDKCRCECKELIDNGRCDKRFIWNPSNCECDCDQLCDAAEYLDYKNSKCRKRLTDKLVEECSENIDENKMIYNSALYDYGKICHFSTIYFILLAIFFIISIRISSVFIHFHWYL